jgi:hypothetical protein
LSANHSEIAQPSSALRSFRCDASDLKILKYNSLN